MLQAVSINPDIRKFISLKNVANPYLVNAYKDVRQNIFRYIVSTNIVEQHTPPNMKTMDNSNQQEVSYDLPFLRSPKWLLIYFIFGLFLILSNLNLESKIDKLVFSALKISPSCQIQIKDYEINVFPLPHLQFNKVNVPGNCMGRGQKAVFLDELAAYFRGPSFSPFGVLFKIETILEYL